MEGFAKERLSSFVINFLLVFLHFQIKLFCWLNVVGFIRVDVSITRSKCQFLPYDIYSRKVTNDMLL